VLADFIGDAEFFKLRFHTADIRDAGIKIVQQFTRDMPELLVIHHP